MLGACAEAAEVAAVQIQDRGSRPDAEDDIAILNETDRNVSVLLDRRKQAAAPPDAP